jgi:hypothetical protein
VFVPGKLIRTSQFIAGAYPSEALYCAPPQCFRPYSHILDSLERLAENKHSSLFCQLRRKSFVTLTAGRSFIFSFEVFREFDTFLIGFHEFWAETLKLLQLLQNNEPIQVEPRYVG